MLALLLAVAIRAGGVVRVRDVVRARDVVRVHNVVRAAAHSLLCYYYALWLNSHSNLPKDHEIL